MTAPYQRKNVPVALVDLQQRVSSLEAIPRSIKVAFINPDSAGAPFPTSGAFRNISLTPLYTNDTTFFTLGAGIGGKTHIQAPMGGCYVMIAGGFWGRDPTRAWHTECCMYLRNVASGQWVKRQPLSLGYWRDPNNVLATAYHSIGIWDRNLESGYDKVGFITWVSNVGGSAFTGGQGGGISLIRFPSLPFFFAGIGVETSTAPATA